MKAGQSSSFTRGMVNLCIDIFYFHILLLNSGTFNIFLQYIVLQKRNLTKT